MLKVPKGERAPSVDSSASTTDSDSCVDRKPLTDSSWSEAISSGISRPSCRGGSSCGSLDVPNDLPEAECPDTQRGFEWELNQFKQGKAPFGAIEGHLYRNCPDIRRSVVEAVGMAASHATLESTKALTERLADSDPFVRRGSVKSLCAVVAETENLNAAELAQQTLVEADACTKYDAIESLMQCAMKGSSRATNAMDWYRSQDKDPSIRLKAEKSLVTLAGCAKHAAVRSAQVSMAPAS